MHNFGKSGVRKRCAIHDAPGQNSLWITKSNPRYAPPCRDASENIRNAKAAVSSAQGVPRHQAHLLRQLDCADSRSKHAPVMALLGTPFVPCNCFQMLSTHHWAAWPLLLTTDLARFSGFSLPLHTAVDTDAFTLLRVRCFPTPQDLALPVLSLAGARDEQAHSDDKHRHKFLHELGLALHLLHRVRRSDQLFPGDRPADCVITVMPSLFYTLRFNTDAMAEPGMPVQKSHNRYRSCNATNTVDLHTLKCYFGGASLKVSHGYPGDAPKIAGRCPLTQSARTRSS